VETSSRRARRRLKINKQRMNRRFFIERLHYLVLVGLSCGCQLIPPTGEAATLAGQEVRGGATVDLQFSINNYFQESAAQGGNPRPTTGRALLMFPKGFDPARPWPILIVTSTSDRDRTSPMDAPWYRDAAMAEGWVVLATDATIRPRVDSVTWRLAMLTAGLQMIRDSWPQSTRWPVAFAGFSGGAKSSGFLGAMLAKNRGFKICGFFLAGMNTDRLSAAYHDYQPPADFLSIPVWLSSGTADQIARPGAVEGVYSSLKRTGFQQVRLEHFAGGHELQRAEIQRALHWFREVGKF
jgi:hypothetical protein